MTKLTWILVALLAVVSLGCDNNRVFEQYEDIPDYKWSKNQTLRFEVEIVDTINPHNLYLNIRNTGAYGYSNLWLFVNKTDTQGETISEKFECKLADDKGKWYGSGFGDLFDLQIPYQQNIIFPRSGIYVFEMVQGMRTDSLEEVVNVGIRVEKANK
jgi:gliding motility-associated lipoprotein GldH